MIVPLGWLWAIEGFHPERWDIFGAGLCLAGAIVRQIYETATRCYGAGVKATALRLFLVLAILVCTLGHRDAAFAHVSETAVSAVHDLGDDDSPSPASHTGHVAHHHCPPALNEDPGALLADYRLTSGRHGMPADMAALPSRDVAPLPEPPTA